MSEYYSQEPQAAVYREAVKKEEGMKRALLIRQYERYYGFRPPEGVDIPLSRTTVSIAAS